MLMFKPQDPFHNGERLAYIQTDRHIIHVDFDYRMKSFVLRIGRPKRLLTQNIMKPGMKHTSRI